MSRSDPIPINQTLHTVSASPDAGSIKKGSRFAAWRGTVADPCTVSMSEHDSFSLIALMRPNP
jgi:hypothetical protein